MTTIVPPRTASFDVVVTPTEPTPWETYDDLSIRWRPDGGGTVDTKLRTSNAAVAGLGMVGGFGVGVAAMAKAIRQDRFPATLVVAGAALGAGIVLGSGVLSDRIGVTQTHSTHMTWSEFSAERAKAQERNFPEQTSTRVGAVFGGAFLGGVAGGVAGLQLTHNRSAPVVGAGLVLGAASGFLAGALGGSRLGATISSHGVPS